MIVVFKKNKKKSKTSSCDLFLICIEYFSLLLSLSLSLIIIKINKIECLSQTLSQYSSSCDFIHSPNSEMNRSLDDVQVLKNPIKSLSDKKEYKLLRLKNGLKVLIVKQDKVTSDDSNEVTRKFKSNLAAVALCVGVGCFNDPHDIQGLSHLAEHMVEIK